MKHRPDVSALANASRELLNQGDAVGAERVLSPIMADLRGDPATLHLMGKVKQAQGKWEDAEHFYRRAVAESLDDGAYYNDLGVVLQTRGEFPEALKVFRAATALMPNVAPCRINLVNCLMAMGDLAEAERETRAYVAAMPNAESWTLLGLVQRSQHRYEDALASAEEALRFAPRLRGLRHNRAIALDRLGRAKEALDAFEELARQDLETPELALNLARALYQQERREDAEKVLEECVTHWPTATAPHLALACMRLARGQGEASTALLEAAIKANPQEHSLRLLCADFLHRNGMSARARALLEEAIRLTPASPAFLSALGMVMDELGRSAESLVLLQRADALMNHAPQTQRNLIAPALRAGRAEDALRIVRAQRQAVPDDQYLIACEALAQRLLSLPGYRALNNYEHLLRVYDLPTPQGYFTAENFNASLGESLRVQLRTAHPLDQSLPNGVQTPRDLRQLNEPNIQEFLAAIDAPIRRYGGGLSANDEVGRRRTSGYRLRACHATLLKRGGAVPNHVHDFGWITAIYFVETPKQPNARAGWIKFGEPPWALAGAGPEHWIEPRAGQIILFPSYFWHGVEPLGDAGERVSITFDIVPA